MRYTLLILFLITFQVSPSRAQKKAPYWVTIIKEYSDYSWEYDSINVEKKDQSIYKVWERITPLRHALTSIRREKYNKFNNEKYLSLDYTLQLMEIDCKEDKLKILEIVDYDTDGKIIHTMDEEGEWSHTVPGSFGNLLESIICESQQKDK